MLFFIIIQQDPRKIHKDHEMISDSGRFLYTHAHNGKPVFHFHLRLPYVLCVSKPVLFFRSPEDLLYGLTHALDPKKVLHERDLDQLDRIHARLSIVLAVSPFHKAIDKTPADGPVGQLGKIILGDHPFCHS